MTIQRRAVMIKQLPEALSRKQQQAFLHEVRNCAGVDRPRIVLDCSNLQQFDKSIVRLLLSCLEEAMKSNGDVKLAALPPGAAAILKQNAADLFDIYDSVADASTSFDRPMPDKSPKVSVPGLRRNDTESTD